MKRRELTVDELVRMNREAIEKTEKEQRPSTDVKTIEVDAVLAAINVIRAKANCSAYTREAMELALGEPMSANWCCPRCGEYCSCVGHIYP